MKNFFVFCLFICVNWAGVFTPLVQAAGKKSTDHISTGTILEYSLLNFKKSLQKMTQKNDRLAFENFTLEKDIQYLERVLEGLIAKKTALSGEVLLLDHQKVPISLKDTRKIRNRERRVQDLITVFEQDIRNLKEQIQLLDGSLDNKMFTSERKLLLERRQGGLRDLSKAEKRLIYLNKRKKAPLKTIKILTEKKGELEEKIITMEKGLARY